MGFNIKNVTAEKPIEITVPLTVNTFEENAAGEPESTEVKHVFTIPTTFMREKYQQLLVRVRGNKVKSQGTSEANIWLWKNAVIRVDGYDELPADESWKSLFEDHSVLRIHAENAITGLMNYLNAEEGDISKK